MDASHRDQEELTRAAERVEYAKSLGKTTIKARVEEPMVPRRQQKRENKLKQAVAMVAATKAVGEGLGPAPLLRANGQVTSDIWEKA